MNLNLKKIKLEKQIIERKNGIFIDKLDKHVFEQMIFADFIQMMEQLCKVINSDRERELIKWFLNHYYRQVIKNMRYYLFNLGVLTKDEKEIPIVSEPLNGDCDLNYFGFYKK